MTGKTPVVSLGFRNTTVLMRTSEREKIPSMLMASIRALISSSFGCTFTLLKASIVLLIVGLKVAVSIVEHLHMG